MFLQVDLEIKAQSGEYKLFRKYNFLLTGTVILEVPIRNIFFHQAKFLLWLLSVCRKLWHINTNIYTNIELF